METELFITTFVIPLTAFDSLKSKFGKCVMMAWSEFKEKLSNPVVGSETQDEFFALSKNEQNELKDVGAYLAGRSIDNTRTKDSIEQISAIVFDVDDASEDTLDKILSRAKFYCLMHSTRKHTALNPRFRVIIPLSHPISVEQREPIARKLASELGIMEECDPVSFRNTQVMLWPSVCKGAEYVLKETESQNVLCPETVLETYKDWHNTLEWPVTSKESQKHKRLLRHGSGLEADMENPTEKPGYIGAFCRAYTVPEAIDKFLPDVYVQGSSEDRYSLADASSTDGLVLFNDGLLCYSHHSSDVIVQRMVNAYDLVRLHLFGGLDKDADPYTPICRMPSCIAMNDMLSDDENVLAELTIPMSDEVDESLLTELTEPILNAPLCEDDFGIKAEEDMLRWTEPQTNPFAINEEVSTDGEVSTLQEQSELPSSSGLVDDDNASSTDDESKYAEAKEADTTSQSCDESKEKAKEMPHWQKCLLKSLATNQNAKIAKAPQNYKAILELDPDYSGIAFNVLSNRIDVKGQAPWRKSNMPGLTDAEYATIKVRISTRYGLYSENMFSDALKDVATARSFNPVVDYVDSCGLWDGTPRLDTFFVDCLGAEDNPYVRMATRVTLVGAVKRAYEPGCKFDTMLILVGAQGRGKSTIWRRLAGQFFSDSLTLSDMEDVKKAAEKMQGYWILEVPELAGASKADQLALKAFLTSQSDNFRAAYARVAETRPRMCIFVGTTNETAGFLRDTTGGRRFLPINVTAGTEKMNPFTLTQDYVDQVWAEAKYLYDHKEPTFLSGDAENLALAVQKSAIVSDERFGLVELYLNTAIPVNWEAMDLENRSNWWKNRVSGMENNANDDAKLRNRVCNLEIARECFHFDVGKVDRKTINEIALIMAKMPGWRRTEKTADFGGYGKQRYYERIAQEQEVKEACSHQN